LASLVFSEPQGVVSAFFLRLNENFWGGWLLNRRIGSGLVLRDYRQQLTLTMRTGFWMARKWVSKTASRILWMTICFQIWATNSAGWDFKGPDLSCVVCRDKNTKAISPEDSIMILLVTRADIERGGEGSFQVLSHPQVAGHTSVSEPHIRVYLLTLHCVGNMFTSS
jgi:hypothetical protein